MTAESLLLCVVLYASCAYEVAPRFQRFADVQQSWGAIRSLEYWDLVDGVRRTEVPELYGPFDVWQDGWKDVFWRIPATAFHHSDLLHLVLTVGAAWYLGSRLERRWGSFAMGAFLIPAVCIPVMAQLCLGQAMIGFSGVVCAMLGALVVLRSFDATVDSDFSETAAQIGIGLVVLGCVASASGLVALPNTAHLVGFAYGVAIAFVTCGPFGSISLLQASVVLVHFWLFPLLLLVIHPLWIGRYHWYQAVTVNSPQQAERNLAYAVALDRSLTGAWLRWSQLAYERGDQDEAWRRMIKGLAFNRTSGPLLDGARRLWRHFGLSERRKAEQVVEDHFGSQSQDWLRQIRAHAPVSNGIDLRDERLEESSADGSEFALDRQLELPRVPFLPGPHNPQKWKDLKPQNDAVEGETL